MKDGQKSPWEIFKSKKNEKVDLRDEMHKDYINDDGFLVPEKTLAFYATSDTRYKLSDVIETLIVTQIGIGFQSQHFLFVYH
jgi:hypothetical protein